MPDVQPFSLNLPPISQTVASQHNWSEAQVDQFNEWLGAHPVNVQVATSEIDGVNSITAIDFIGGHTVDANGDAADAAPAN